MKESEEVHFYFMSPPTLDSSQTRNIYPPFQPNHFPFASAQKSRSLNYPIIRYMKTTLGLSCCPYYNFLKLPLGSASLVLLVLYIPQGNLLSSEVKKTMNHHQYSPGSNYLDYILNQQPSYNNLKSNGHHSCPERDTCPYDILITGNNQA